jgi:hypothetical protein
MNLGENIGTYQVDTVVMFLTHVRFEVSTAVTMMIIIFLTHIQEVLS